MKWLFIFYVFVSVDSLDYSGIPENVTSSNVCTDKNHLFLAPGVLTAGGNNRACISRFYPDGPARMLLTLLTADQHTVAATRELQPGDGGCVDIAVPLLPNTKADLIVNLRYPEASCTWERRMAVRITSGRLVVVTTERARYRPGDVLRTRIIVLKADLAPAHGVIDEIWLEGPSEAWAGARAAQWTHVRTRLGIAQIQHELDELAPPGKWTMRAKLADGSQGSADFWVGNYELSPFQLSVRHAPRVLRTSERLVWTVCVRYPWTEAVEGMLVIRLRGAGGSLLNNEAGGVRTAVRLRAPRACHRHAAAARRVGLDGVNPPDVVIADFSFQEEGTRIWQNTTVVSQVVDSPVTLEFLTKHRVVLAPGLPYKLKVKATRWDDKPASNGRVRICRSPANSEAELTQVTSVTATGSTCVDALTDVKGVARVMFTADNDGAAFYRFQATLQNISMTAASLVLPVQRAGTTHAAFGPLRGDSHASRSFVPLYVNIRDVTTPLTVHFVVITRGGVIYRWGATTQCPIANTANHIQTASRNSACSNLATSKVDATGSNNAETYKVNADGSHNAETYKVNAGDQNNANTSDLLLDRQLLQVTLPIKVSHQMCPDSHLVAYFYYNGELVSASKHFELEECFVNKVEATWISRQTSPGSTATLHLATPGPALCALSVLDTAAKWTTPVYSVKDALMAGLRRLIDSHRNLTEYDEAGKCFMSADNLDLPTSSLELTATWLAAAGVRLLGSTTQNKRCENTAPSPLTADDRTVARSDFSEAWLWRLVSIDANGSAITSARAPDSITRFEAAAVCVARNGVAVSPPAVLQVFREFFIHADSPRRLRRGDTTILRYRIFNYLYEPLSVQIQILADPHLDIPAGYAESACIAARASVARRAEVRATLPGAARLSVRAKAISDGNCANFTSNRNKTEVSDEVIIQIDVEPEGVPVHEQRSMLLCGKGSEESSSSEVSWRWPSVQNVPGTETMTVWAVSDITGPLLADADALVMLPRGCGEQNMARLATNLLALQQLDPRGPAAATAKEHVARGFTRQLQYAHPSGGFSAFGASDATASTWLTAFALRYLKRAHQVLTPWLPAPPALDRAQRWLLSQQMENGCFRNEGQVFHKELKGGLNEEGEIASVALTAYVITSLVESSVTLPSRVLRNTLSCLRALPPLKTKTPTKVYAHALLAYTFMRLRRYELELKRTNEASLLWDGKGTVGAGLQQDEEIRELVELLRIARRNEDFVWWETGSLSTSIEATSYALLSLSLCPPSLRDTSCARDARAAVRWLSTHRNAAGGFISTQDTLVALEALISWSSIKMSSPTNLNVTARSGGSEQTMYLHSGIKIPDILKMTVGDQLNIAVEGNGCALVQATRVYNTLSPGDARSAPLSVQVSVHVDGPFDCDTNGTSCFCAAIVEACVVWAGEFPEMALLEVALPGGFGADASRLYSQLHHPDTLLRRIELSPNGGRATLYLGPRAGSFTLGRSGHQCYSLHAVGPRARTKPAYARVLDYYKPMVNDTQMYTIPEDCPARISHESNQYLTSDNLYNKAKSLSDNGEIIITDEYTFEDIPEGIPLEDPMYDNLTQTDEEDKTDIEDNDRVDADRHKDIEKPEKQTEKQTRYLDNDNEIPKNDGKVENVTNDTRQELRDLDDRTNIDNPNLSNFHVIDTEKDLELPAGVEGPVPAVVLPPQNFVPQIDIETTPTIGNSRSFHASPPYTYFFQQVNENAYLRNSRKYNSPG